MTKKLSRDDWLAAGLNALIRVGPDGIHVEPLAQSMGVTKGSFYWHFKDLQELIASVIDRWAERMIGAVRAHDELSGSPEDRLLAVMREITQENRGRYEAAMRTWATSNELARDAVRRVDEARLEWTESLFHEMGFAPQQAEIRARMMVFYEYGEAEFSLESGLNERLEYIRHRHAILTAGAGVAEPATAGDGGET